MAKDTTIEREEEKEEGRVAVLLFLFFFALVGEADCSGWCFGFVFRTERRLKRGKSW